jgi:hypothetical protein
MLMEKTNKVKHLMAKSPLEGKMTSPFRRPPNSYIVDVTILTEREKMITSKGPVTRLIFAK